MIYLDSNEMCETRKVSRPRFVNGNNQTKNQKRNSRKTNTTNTYFCCCCSEKNYKRTKNHIFLLPLSQPYNLFRRLSCFFSFFLSSVCVPVYAILNRKVIYHCILNENILFLALSLSLHISPLFAYAHCTFVCNGIRSIFAVNMELRTHFQLLITHMARQSITICWFAGCCCWLMLMIAVGGWLVYLFRSLFYLLPTLAVAMRCCCCYD